MKIIDGKHYVDGGPKCYKCGGTGNTVFRDRNSEPHCPACNSTGLSPVESWTEDQYAAWVKKTTNCDGLNLFWFRDPEADGRIIWGIRICYEDAPPVEYKLGHHEDISDALYAAVIAVAEESK